jgi:signal transduction histidine kinase
MTDFASARPSAKRPVDINEVIESSLRLASFDKGFQVLSIHRRFTSEMPKISADSDQMQQVFLNLFLNARDAMPNGGVLDVRTCIVDARIEIVVTDSGSGISRDNIKKIYDPFFTTKTAGKGTGLGPSVSYGIVQEHGGNISVESNVGKGTSFRLDFPLSRKAVNV